MVFFRMPIRVFHRGFRRQFLGFHQLRLLLHLRCLYLDGVFALAAGPPNLTLGPPSLDVSQAELTNLPARLPNLIEPTDLPNRSCNYWVANHSHKHIFICNFTGGWLIVHQGPGVQQ